MGALLAAVALLVPVAHAGAKSLHGIVLDIPSGRHVRVAPVAHAAGDLPLGGGPVLHSNRTHLIFWEPSGSGLSFPPGYISLIEGYLRNVAADSHKPSNVYSLTGQYTDSTGRAVYNSVYAGAVIDTDPLPGRQCGPIVPGPGWVDCVTDSQIQDEIQHVVSVDHLPTYGHTGRDTYFLVTPEKLGDCQGPGTPGYNNPCSLAGQDFGYCGYHFQNQDDSIIYAVIPYNAVAGHCQSDNPRPNNNPADPAISTLSHEHNEMITDPLGDAWIDSSGNEDGDLCLQTFGNDIGGSGNFAWNESIHGGHYYLQAEYSNVDGQCEARARPDWVSFSVPSRIVAGKRASFSAFGHPAYSGGLAYTWFFGSSPLGHGPTPRHTYKRAGAYRIVLRGQDLWGNWAFDAGVIRVTRH